MTLIVSYGGGTNSTAELIEMQKRNIIPDLILFADTGGERPETYEYLQMFSKWLRDHGMPEIVTVRKVDKEGKVMTLEQNCLEKRMLPSLAYGFKSCSQKFKIAPQDKYCNHFGPALNTWAKGEKVIKAIGYDADEERRAKIYDSDKYSYWYPLIEWGYGRSECQQIIHNAGLPQAGKSSCFFCPSMKKREILELKDNHPDLLQRALYMELRAVLTTVKGLGRSFEWNDVVTADEQQLKMFCEVIDESCNCYDG